MQTAVHVLIRDDDDDPPVLVRAFRSYEAALAACEAAHRYLAAEDAPPAPGSGPEGFTVMSVVGTGLVYRDNPEGAWLSEVESRRLHQVPWMLYDARAASHYWWRRANPIDPDAPLGSVYAVVAVEYADA